MDFEQEKTTALYPPVGADGGQPLSKEPSQSIAEDTAEYKTQADDLEEIMQQIRRASDPAYLPTVSMNDLYEQVFPGRPPVIDGLLYAGTYLFVGAPKVGKSFLMAQLAYHVSMGIPLWGYAVNRGTVLYLALEDDHRRLQDRLYRMFGENSTENLYFAVYLHIDFIPFTTGSKRGLETRVSLKQALAAQGFQGGSRGDTEWNQWVRSEKDQLSLVMQRHGIEWEKKDTHEKHLSVLDYKKEQRTKEIAALETVKAEKESEVAEQEQRLSELAPAVKNMERLAADFSADPEEILPEAGTLESAKSYREKKAKPLLAQIVKVLRSLYLAYVELRGKFERLQGDYGRVRESNARLSDRLQEVKLENKALRQVSADYERAKRVFARSR